MLGIKKKGDCSRYWSGHNSDSVPPQLLLHCGTGMGRVLYGDGLHTCAPMVTL